MAVDSILEISGKLHTTALGAERIKKNLQIETDDVVSWCRTEMLDRAARLERRGKNWYVITANATFTINARSCTIITAHKRKTS